MAGQSQNGSPFPAAHGWREQCIGARFNAPSDGRNPEGTMPLERGVGKRTALGPFFSGPTKHRLRRWPHSHVREGGTPFALHHVLRRCVLLSDRVGWPA